MKSNCEMVSVDSCQLFSGGEGVTMVVQLATETHCIRPISAQDVILALV